jgi:hypothetical protein
LSGLPRLPELMIEVICPAKVVKFGNPGNRGVLTEDL